MTPLREIVHVFERMRARVRAADKLQKGKINLWVRDQVRDPNFHVSLDDVAVSQDTEAGHPVKTKLLKKARY